MQKTALLNLLKKRLKKSLNPIIILNYKDSIQKLKEIIENTEPCLEKIKMSDSLPFISFFLALKAELKILEYLNDERLNCDLAWDERTGLPSHPSIVADANSYVRYLKPRGMLKNILESFYEWTLFFQQEYSCCCGGKFKERKVALSFLLNHALETGSQNGLIVKQFVGIKSGDFRHLEHHYDFRKISKVAKNLQMIWICENQIEPEGRAGLKVKLLKLEKSEQFNDSEFKNWIFQLMNFSFSDPP